MASEHAKKAARLTAEKCLGIAEDESGILWLDAAQAFIQAAIDAAVKEERASAVRLVRQHQARMRKIKIQPAEVCAALIGDDIENGEHLKESGE